ncbi:hypothetical protein CR513_04609, partial [Mucuna pruriens]
MAPSQLHPNVWANVQAFRVICQALVMILSASIFFNHYTARVGEKVGWVSLAPLLKGSLFNAYATYYKGIKGRLIKVKAIGEARFNTNSRPLPLYWKLPDKFKGLYKGQLSLEDRVDLQLLEELPRGMNYKELVAPTFKSKPTYYLKNLLNKQGFDMEALIRKAVRVTKARVALTSARDAVVAEKEVVPIVAEKETTSTEKEMEATVAGRGPIGPLPQFEPSSAAKGKVDAAEEETCKNGKANGQALPQPISAATTSTIVRVWVIVTLGPNFPVPQLPPCELSCFAAPPTANSLWGFGLEKSSDVLSKDFGVARAQIIEVEAASASDKEAKVQLEAALKTTEGKLGVAVEKIGALESKSSKAKEEMLGPIAKLDCLEGGLNQNGLGEDLSDLVSAEYGQTQQSWIDATELDRRNGVGQTQRSWTNSVSD